MFGGFLWVVILINLNTTFVPTLFSAHQKHPTIKSIQDISITINGPVPHTQSQHTDHRNHVYILIQTYCLHPVSS